MIKLFKSKVPAWAAPLGAEGFAKFCKKLLEASDNKIDARKADKNGSLNVSGHMIHLANLIELCSRLEPDEWGTEISRWTNVFATGGDRADPIYPRDINMLKLQLYPENYFSQVSADTQNMLIEDYIPGALTVVVADWPDMVIALQDDDPKTPWLSRRKEVFSKLLDRLASEAPYDVNFMESGRGGEDVIAVIESPDITTATHALVLDKLYPQLLGKNGALVGLPLRHMIILKRLDTPATPEMVAHLSGMVKHMSSQTNYFISDHVDHYENGRMKRASRD